jgi:hypothetical protein
VVVVVVLLGVCVGWGGGREVRERERERESRGWRLAARGAGWAFRKQKKQNQNAQQRAGVLQGHVLELQHGRRPARHEGGHDFIHDRVVGRPTQARAGEARVQRVVCQAGVVGADVDDDGQDARRVKTRGRTIES